MDKQTRIIKTEDFGPAPLYKSSDERGFTRTLETVIEYDLGGRNWFSGQQKQRGIYVGVRMRERREGDGMRVERLGIGSGTYIVSLIEPAARFNAKRLASIVPDQDLVARIRQQVLDKVARNDEQNAALYGPPVLAGR